MNDINIAGIDHAELLAALYNSTSPLGNARAHDLGRDMTAEEARDILAKMDGRFNFDYLLGRPLKVWVEGDKLCRPDLYDRDSKRTCAAIVEELRRA